MNEEYKKEKLINEELKNARLKSPLNPLDFSLDEMKSLKEMAESDWYLLREYPGSVLGKAPGEVLNVEEYLEGFSPEEVELYKEYYQL